MEFEVADATKRQFADHTFDVIYSRDTILHIKDKAQLFTTFMVSSISLLYYTAYQRHSTTLYHIYG